MQVETVDIIPEDTPLVDILLPNKWVLYLYDKQLFRNLANKQNVNTKPHKEVCKIETLNDLVYLLKIMEVKVDQTENKTMPINLGMNKINLDMNDYIIMREGIEPIWEDPKNSNGGTFTIKMAHKKGYLVWSTFIKYMLGETMIPDMENINGISVSYIPETEAYGPNPNIRINNSNDDSFHTYVKVWDGKSDRTRNEFLELLPEEIIDIIQTESIKYYANNKKKDFNEKNIIEKLINGRSNSRKYNGFSTHQRSNNKGYYRK